MAGCLCGRAFLSLVNLLAFYYQFWHTWVMNGLPPLPHKPLEWVGRALEELRALPAPVRRSMGFALRFAQAGVKPNNAKPLRGFKGAGVLEVIEDYDGDTYRAVYTVKLAGIVYVLHCFQKKSRKGIETPKQTIALIHQRLRAAETMHKERNEKP
jgi:phage-related protein